MDKSWFLDRVEKLIWDCGGRWNQDMTYDCDSCPLKEECFAEWSELCGNLDSQAIFFHIVRICDLVDAHKKETQKCRTSTMC